MYYVYTYHKCFFEFLKLLVYKRNIKHITYYDAGLRINLTT